MHRLWACSFQRCRQAPGAVCFSQMLFFGEFVDRVGGMIVAPRSTLRAALLGHRGGMRDLLALALLQLLALKMPALTRSIFGLLDGNLQAAIVSIVSLAARGLLLPVGIPIVCGLLFGLLIRHRRLISAEQSRLARGDDIAALCALPALSLQIVTTLAQLLLRLPLPMGALRIAQGLWFAGLLLCATTVLRRISSSANPAEPAAEAASHLR